MAKNIDRAARAVISAITNQGPVPSYHLGIMRRHQREWPTLWNALGDLRDAVHSSPPSIETHGLSDAGAEGYVVVAAKDLADLGIEVR